MPPFTIDWRRIKWMMASKLKLSIFYYIIWLPVLMRNTNSFCVCVLRHSKMDACFSVCHRSFFNSIQNSNYIVVDYIRNAFDLMPAPRNTLLVHERMIYIFHPEQITYISHSTIDNRHIRIWMDDDDDDDDIGAVYAFALVTTFNIVESLHSYRQRRLQSINIHSVNAHAANSRTHVHTHSGHTHTHIAALVTTYIGAFVKCKSGTEINLY